MANIFYTTLTYLNEDRQIELNNAWII